MQLAAIIVSLVLTAVGVALFGLAIPQICHFVTARPARTGRHPYGRTRAADGDARQGVPRPHPDEPLGHVGVAHWFVAVGFLSLGLTIVNAFGQLFKADWLLPVIGAWLPYDVFVEFIEALFTTLGILVLIAVRLMNPALPGTGASRGSPDRPPGQAFFVEYVVLVIEGPWRS